MIDFSYGIKIWAEVSFVLSHFTRLTDRQTDFNSNTVCMHSQSHGKICINAHILYVFEANKCTVGFFRDFRTVARHNILFLLFVGSRDSNDRMAA